MGRPLRPRALRRLPIQQIRAVLAREMRLDPAIVRALLKDPRRGVRGLAIQWQRRDTQRASEAARLESLFTVEAEYRTLGYGVIAGVDEVGVAPLAGPVIAAAVILPEAFHLPELNDSKQLTADQRAAMYETIGRDALAISIGDASVEEIDQLNILQATRLAHKRAIEGLTQRPDLVLIDGRYAAAVPIPQLVLVDGDARCAAIAAASIVAKVTRDRLMVKLGDQYPQYGFARHKGYGTRDHIQAIRQFGITGVHRRSFARFRGVQELLAIESP